MANIKETIGPIQALIEGSRNLKRDLDIAFNNYKNYQELTDLIENSILENEAESSLNENNSLIMCFSSTLFNTIESNLKILYSLNNNQNSSNTLRFQNDGKMEFQQNYLFEDYRDFRICDDYGADKITGSPQFKVLNNSIAHFQELSNYQSRYEASLSSHSKTLNKRGPYRKYNKNVKLNAILRVKGGEDIRQVSKDIKIPIKNVKRWLEFGPERKKGGGRKTLDPEMEDDLYEWCLAESKRKEGRPLSRSTLKQAARKFSRFPTTFKASKGWLDKFIKRYKISGLLAKPNEIEEIVDFEENDENMDENETRSS